MNRSGSEQTCLMGYNLLFLCGFFSCFLGTRDFLAELSDRWVWILDLHVMCGCSFLLVISRTQGLAFQRPCHYTKTSNEYVGLKYISLCLQYAGSDDKLQLDCFNTFSSVIYFSFNYFWFWVVMFHIQLCSFIKLVITKICALNFQLYAR